MCVRFSGVVGLLCLVFILVLNSTSVFNVVSEYSSWIFFSEYVSQRVVLYDGDLDGEPELLYIDNYYFYNLTTIPHYTGVTPFKVDLGANSILCTALYRVLDGFITVRCPYGSYSYNTLVNATIRVHRWGLLLTNTTHRSVLVAGRVYSLPGNLEGVPLVINGEPVVLGVYEGYIVLYDPVSGSTARITPSYITILEASYDAVENAIYAIGLDKDTTVFFKYNIATGVDIPPKPLIITLKQVVATTSTIYVLSTNGVLYAVNATGELVEIAGDVVALYYPADSVDSFVALTSSKVLKIVESSGEITIHEHLAPPVPVSEVYAVDWWSSTLAVATSSGVYVATTKPVYVFIRAPVSVYAGEYFRVEVSGVYDSVVVSINGRVYYGNVTLRLPPGNFTVTARACRGVFCVENTTSILVLRRPLEVRVEYPSVTKPYDSLTVFVETIDKLTNTSVVVSCTISDPRGHVHEVFNSGGNITVPAIPDVDSSVFTVTCGGGNYEIVSVTVRSKLTEPYLKIKFNYYGSGLLEISGYDVYTGEDWDGLVVVEYLDLDIVVTGERSALVTLPPGSTRLNISLVKNNITYYTEEVTVVYYEDVFMVPAGMPVIVGDRVKVDVYTLTETITRPFPVYYEIRVVDPLIVAATAAFTAGAVYAILMILGRLPRIKRGE